LAINKTPRAIIRRQRLTTIRLRREPEARERLRRSGNLGMSGLRTEGVEQMKKNLITATAVCLLITAGVAAAEQVPTSKPRATTTVAPATEFLAAIPADSLPITAWYKQSVYDTTNTKIGDIADVLVSPTDGKIAALIVGVGGFLGMGEKDIAVAFNEVKWTMRDNKNYPTIQATKEALRTAPGFKYDPKTSNWIAAETSTK